MRTLLIDNYDSFTFNLYQLIAEVNGEPPLVVRNDRAPWSELRCLPFDNVVLSPGPGRPERAQDFGVCREALGEPNLPILGVCLGHQGLCAELGGRVDQADPVMHGRPSSIHHDGTGLFEGLPSPFEVIRYHSLLVSELPEELRATARTADGLLMAVEHRERPLFGVQFHPESIGSEHGRALLGNFARRTAQHWQEHDRSAGLGDGSLDARPYDIAPAPDACAAPQQDACDLRVFHRELRSAPGPLSAFEQLCTDGAPSFWLDSARTGGPGRFSFMGDASGPLDECLTADQAGGLVSIRRNGATRSESGTIFEHLERRLRERSATTDELPFAFTGGFVGYLGYELDADCAALRMSRSSLPDAGFLAVHRFLAIDHEDDRAWLVCVDHPGQVRRASAWLKAQAARLEALPAPAAELTAGPSIGTPPTEPLPRRMRHDEAAYLERVRAAKRAIREGESYELCLTNRLEFDVAIDPWRTYRALRAHNPAPFAAWLDLPGVQILSASPERFLSVDALGAIEAKPIKGTRPRGRTPAEDEALKADLASAEKDRAENLIIIDLLRNDIGRVASAGSVHVPRRFDVETYATVHQLVSTIRGQLRPGLSAVDAVRAAFPGGSMTGAPKRRTLELLDALEQGPRGVYSGALGYFSLNGAADLSIVIRTIVVEPGCVSVGVGGAIVDLSDPAAELAEMLLKAEGSIAALERTAARLTPTAAQD